MPGGDDSRSRGAAAGGEGASRAERVLDLVLGLAPGGAGLVVDGDLRVLAAGGALWRHGWVPESVQGRLLADCVAPTVLERIEPGYRGAVSGESRTLEFTSPETGRTYVQRYAPVPGRDGDVPLGVSVWVEVSEQGRLAEELAASERRYRELAERSSDVIILFDRGLVFRYVSPAMERVAGWAPAELVGTPVPAVLHPDDLPVIGQRVALLFAGEGDHLPPSEFRLRCADGSWVWIEGIETPIRDPTTGEIEALQATGRDITARKRAEELFSALADVAPVGVFRAGLDGGVVYCNARWSEITGLPRGGGLGFGWVESLHPDDRAAIVENWANGLAGRSEPRAAYRVQRPDGSVRHVVTEAVPLVDAVGAVTGWVGAVTDVTALKEAEAERLALEARLQQAQKLESLGVLAGGVAHDFNNLLMGVLGNAALAQAEVPEGSSARQSLAQIETAARRAAELTRQMLAYSGKGHFVVERADLAELLRESARLLAVTLRPGIQLTLDLPEGLPRVEGDVTQLRQVAMNLVVNAGEAVEGDGVVAVSLSVAELGPDDIARLAFAGELEPGPYLMLRVVDTGSGMDADTLGRIFEPFFTTKFTGRGLGLAATLGIVRGHRGGVDVQSTPGGGTAFAIYLPPAPDPATAAGSAGEPAASAPAGIPGAVLVVDDDDMVRAVIRRMLQSREVTALEARSGDEALAAVRADPAGACVVLLDRSLPGLAGPALVAELRAAGLTAPVVLTSGHAEDDGEGGAGGGRAEAAFGAAGFLQKPFGVDELLTALRAALGL